MTKTMSQKLQVIALWMCMLVITLTMAHALTLRFNMNDDLTINQNSATISWETDEVSLGSVQYSRENELPRLRQEVRSDAPGQQHSVTLENLEYQTRYGFQITGVGEAVDNEPVVVIDNNDGDFYRFATPALPAPARDPEAGETPPEDLPERSGDQDDPDDLATRGEGEDEEGTLPGRIGDEDTEGTLPGQTGEEDEEGTLPGRIGEDGEGDADGEGDLDGRGRHSGAVPTEEPSEPTLFITAEVPEFIKTTNLVITGTTLPRATLKIYVNPSAEEIGGAGYKAIGVALADGTFRIPLGGLTGENTIVIYAQTSQTAEEEETTHESYSVTVDPDAPVVEVDIPKFIENDFVPIKGTVNEDVTLLYHVHYITQPTQPTTVTEDGLPVRLEDQVGEIAIPAGNFTADIPAGAVQELLSTGENKAVRTLFSLKLTFSDRAQNTRVFEQNIRLLPDKPQILESNIDELSPSYVQAITLKGKATPGSTVIAVVNGETGPHEAWSLSLRDTVTSIGVRFTPGHDEYSVEVGDDGEFELDVLLSRKIRSQTQAHIPQPYDVSSVEAGYESGRVLTDQDKGQFVNTIELIAIDELTELDPTRYHKLGPVDVMFAKCGAGSYWEIATTKPTPSVIIPQHLRLGLSMVGFDMYFKWMGPGTQGIMKEPPKLRVLPLSKNALKDYNFDPQELVRKPIKTKYSTDYKTAAVIVEFNQFDYEQKALGDIEIKDDLLVEIPLEVEMNFEYEEFGKRIRTTQKNCIDFSTVLDLEMPTDAIPKDLLNATINVFTKTIDVIDGILKPLKKIAIVLFVACLLSWVWLFLKMVDERMECIGVMGNDDAKQEAKDACNKAKNDRREFEENMKWVCDRTFCPAAPTLEKYTKEMMTRKEVDKHTMQDYDAQDSMCVKKAGALGAEGLPNMEAVYQKLGTPTTDDNILDDTVKAGWKDCAAEYKQQWDSACVGQDELEKSACIYYNNDPTKAAPGKLAQKCKTGVVEAASSLCRYVENKKEGTVVHWVKGSRACPQSNRIPAIQTGKDDRFFQLKKQGNDYYWIEVEKRIKPDRIEEDTYSIDKVHFVTVGQPLSSLEAENFCLTQKAEKDYVVDPTAGLITSVQCACVPAFAGYLQLWRNILSQGKACFQTVMKTGKPSSGLCRAWLTRYLCDLAIDAVRCFAQRYGAGGGGVLKNREGGVSGFLRSVSSAGTAIQTSIAGRYGRSTLYRTLFNEKKLIHSACLWAFTGDFDFDLEGALTGVGAIPIESECLVHPVTRRFMTSNPVNRGLATFMYHVGAGLAAGADLNYRLELVCSAATNCDPSTFPGGKCDCFDHRRGEQVLDITRTLGNGFAAAGEWVDEDIYFPAIEHPYRYDRVRMKYNYRDNEGKLKEVVCYDDQIEKIGDDPLMGCQFDVMAGYYHCDADVGDRGYAAFIRQPIPVKPYFQINDLVEVEVEIEKHSPGFSRDEYIQQQVLNPAGVRGPAAGGVSADPTRQLPFFLAYSLRDHTGRLIRDDGSAPISNVRPVNRYNGPRLGREIIKILEDGVMKVTLPKTRIKDESVGSSFTGGQLGRVFDAQPYSNPRLSGPIETRSMLPAARNAYRLPVTPINRNVFFSIIAFRNRNNELCYAIEEAGRQDNTSGSQSILKDFNLQSLNENGDPSSRDCTDQSDLPQEQKNYLRGHTFLLQRDYVSFQGVKVYLDANAIQKEKGLYAAGIVHEAPALGRGYENRDCTPNNPLHWKLELELLYCKPDQSLSDTGSVLGSGVGGTPQSPMTRIDYERLNAQNCREPSDQVVVFNGQAQSFVGEQAIDIPIVCRDAPKADDYGSCSYNERLTGGCDCGGTICGEYGGNNYCKRDGDNYECLSYEACTRYDPLHNNRYVEPTNPTNMCDCDGVPGAGTGMECPTGNFCVKCPNIPEQSVCVDPSLKDNPPACDRMVADVQAQDRELPGIDQKDIFRFAIISESGVPDIKKDTDAEFPEAETTKLGPGVEKTIEKIQQLMRQGKIDFVIHNGNMINAGKFLGFTPRAYAPNAGQSMWQLYKSQILDQLNTRNKKRVIPVPGWKDVTPDSPFYSLFSTFWNNHAPADLENRDGNYPYYYSFDRGNNHFIILDTTKVNDPEFIRGGTIFDERQKNWLVRDLEKLKLKKYSNVFVFSSAGLVSLKAINYPGLAKEEGRVLDVIYTEPVPPRMNEAQQNELINLLKGKATVLFTNNEGVYLKGKLQGMDIVSTGAIGQGSLLTWQAGKGYDPSVSFVLVEVLGPKIGIDSLSALITSDGQVRTFNSGTALGEQFNVNKFPEIAASDIPLKAPVPEGLAILNDCQLTPYPTLETKAKGTYQDGSLENGMQSTKGPYINSVHRHGYGTYELVSGIERAACAMFKKFNIKMAIGDLSSKNGGKLGGHKSHQNGLDLDIKLFSKKGGTVTNSGGRFDPKKSVFDVESNWHYVKSFVNAVDVYMIFLDQRYIDMLSTYAEQNNIAGRDKVLGKLRHEPGHDNHFHIRLACPIGDDCSCPPRNPNCKATRRITKPKPSELARPYDYGEAERALEGGAPGEGVPPPEPIDIGDIEFPPDEEVVPPPPLEPNFDFAVISDTHDGHCSDTLSENVPQALASISQLKPSFVIHLGDMVTEMRGGECSSEDVDLMWNTYAEHVYDPLLSQDIPVIPVPSEEETRTVIGKQKYEAFWKARQPYISFIDETEYPFKYAFEYGNLGFIVLPYEGERLSSRTKTWLRNKVMQISQSKESVVILSSMPPSRITYHAADSASPYYWFGNDVDNQLKFLKENFVDLILTSRHKAYFRGKLHYYDGETVLPIPLGVNVVSTGSLSSVEGDIWYIPERCGPEDRDIPRCKPDSTFVVGEVRNGVLQEVYALKAHDFTRTFPVSDLPVIVGTHLQEEGFNPWEGLAIARMEDRYDHTMPMGPPDMTPVDLTPEEQRELRRQQRMRDPFSRDESALREPEVETDDFSFAVISDTNNKGCAKEQGEAVPAAIQAIKNSNAKFVVHVGDMIAGGTRGVRRPCPDYDAMWQDYHNKVVAQLDMVQKPVFPVPGNHDVKLPEEQGYYNEFWSRPPHVEGMEWIDSRVYPRGYAFDYKGHRFIMLPYEGTLLSDATQNWIDLLVDGAHSAGKKTFIFSHMPLARMANYDKERDVYWYGVEPLANFQDLSSNGVKFVFTGHHQAYFKGVIGGLHTATVGGLGYKHKWYIPNRCEEQNVPDNHPYCKEAPNTFVKVDIKDGQLEYVYALKGPTFNEIYPDTAPPANAGPPLIRQTSIYANHRRSSAQEN